MTDFLLVLVVVTLNFPFCISSFDMSVILGFDQSLCLFLVYHCEGGEVGGGELDVAVCAYLFHSVVQDFAEALVVDIDDKDSPYP